MFSGFMADTWTVATIVAVVAGVVGFFVVLRGSAFVADALPTGAFAGAAGASLIGVSTLAGLGVFSLAGALGIGWLGRRARHDVATALAASYTSNGPVGFFVGIIGAFCYAAGRGWTAWRRTRTVRAEAERDSRGPAVAC